MTTDPKTWLLLAFIAAAALTSFPDLWNWGASLIGAGVQKIKSKAAPTSAADRTPGNVLDCLNADLDYLRANTDAPAELLAQVEAVAPYLMHKRGASGLAAPPATRVSA